MSVVKEEGCISYLGSVLQNSMVTGLPQIVTAPTIPKKLLRVLFFVICMAGFLYQLLEILNMYWQYETILNMRVENPKRTKIPAITVCTNDAFDITFMCRDPKYRSKCVLLPTVTDNSFCRIRPRTCLNGVLQNLTVPIPGLLGNLSTAEYREYQPHLILFRELFRFCGSDFKESVYHMFYCDAKFENIRCPDEHTSMQACYTIHSIVDRADRKVKEMSTDTIYTLVLENRPKEENIYIEHSKVHMSIHHPRTIVSPYVYGFQLEEGVINRFRLTRIVKQLLPPPYDTNCKDYLKDWEVRRGNGPTTEKECIEECQRNSSLEIYGCIVHTLKSPTNERICADVTDNEPVYKAAQECAKAHCRPACYEVTYIAIKEEPKFVGDMRYIFKEEDYELMTQSGDFIVTIRLDGLQTTFYTYSTKYKISEIFGYIGGYIGLWLGISLVAVFDFLESMVIILRYSWRQIKQYRPKKQRVQQISTVDKRLKRPNEDNKIV